MVWSKRKLLEKENKFQEMERQKQIELIKAIIDTEETQKTKIARDLHDQIITSITLAAMNLDTRLNELESGSGDLSTVRAELENFVLIADNVREITYDLIPKMFTTFGLIKSIETAVKQLNTLDSKTSFHNSTTFSGALPFTDKHQLTIYRICLEVLINLRKHAAFKKLTVTLEGMPSVFILAFAHDGIGLTNEQVAKLADKNTGIGLMSMMTRIVSVGGKIDYTIEKDVSFITLTIPIDYETNN